MFRDQTPKHHTLKYEPIKKYRNLEIPKNTEGT